MNPRRLRLIVAAIGGLVVAWIAWRTADATYFAPRRALDADLEKAQSDIAGFRSREVETVRVRRALREVADVTLGGDVQTVDHFLRIRLNRIAEATGLAHVVVGSGAPTSVGSPARSAMPRRGPWRALRGEVDLGTLEGTISGEGTLAQVAEVVDRVDAEPWPKQIVQVRVDPRGDGEHFRITLRVRSLFLPGRMPAVPVDRREVVAWDSGRLAAYGGLLNRAPFRLPEKPVEVAAAPPPPPPDPGPPAFPFAEWRLTGVAEGPDGPEAWLRSGRNGRSRVLRPGDAIGPAILESTLAEAAIFRQGDDRFRVVVGGNLDRRSPVDR